MDVEASSPGGPKVLPFKGFLMYVAAPKDSDTDDHTKTLLVATEHLFMKENIEDPNSSWVSIEHNIHGDQHAIAFAGANRWYVGDDGGAWATTNRGETWNSLNEDLRTMEYFSAAASSGSGTYAGGTQDNGPVATTGGPAWKQLFFGDGMYVAPDPKDPRAFFMSEPYGDIFYVPVSDPGNTKKVVSFRDLRIGADFLAPL